MNPINIDYYDQHANDLATQYNSLSFKEVHRDWLDLIPNNGFALDVGCGSGRDAAALADTGLSVIAIDPSKELLTRAKSQFTSPNISWLDDSLPELENVYKLGVKFDLILLSAVWMHIPVSERDRCFRKLAQLLNANGVLVITLRHGASTDERVMLPVNQDEILKLARSQGLVKESASHSTQEDKLKRSDVSWETITLRLPDDGTGAFPLIRNIVINDNKSSTYKLALLRSLIRVAEGHPGAVISRTATHVELPLGLVALYWVKLYKPLIDKFQMQQNSNSGKGLSFIKEKGWLALPSLGLNDLNIGSSFFNSDEARAINQTIRDAAQTIKSMPAKYITLPNSKQAVFDVEYKQGKKIESLIIDSLYLQAIGSLYIPVNIWDNFSKFSIWIEPALINEWINTMSSYSGNRERSFDKADYLAALEWADPVRSTSRVRKRVHSLQQTHTVNCCWSSTRIKPTTHYAIDHCFPYARWPNNDLWNLLPTKETINSQKSDRLPSAHKLADSQSEIIEWWQMAWEKDHQEFFTQANLSLPQLHVSNFSYSEVFEGLILQRARIREIQQLTEWG